MSGPVAARDAASLVIWRQVDGRTEVLMGLRVAGHRFMPNRLVFPGGSVDPSDYTAPVAAPPRPDVLALLARSAEPALARALAYTAARELEEETALSLGRPPALDGLDYLCRAVTPPVRPIRFNARFLAVAADRVHGTLAGSGELEALRFYDIDEALGHELVDAQLLTLRTLRTFLAMPEADRRAPRRTPLVYDREVSLE